MLTSVGGRGNVTSGFFLSLFRHIQYLGRRGCWRTALEYCKLLGGYVNERA